MSSFPTKALVVNDYGTSYFRPFAHLGLEYTTDTSLLDSDPDCIGIVIFTGGADVSPDMYGDEKHPTTGCSPERDKQELRVFKKARALGIPFAGICRGAQFLCVMAGGTLVQNMTGHAGPRHRLAYYHENGDVGVSVETVTSTHHQMQNPFGLPIGDYEIVAWTPTAKSSTYGIGAKNYSPDCVSKNILTEPDVVIYPRIKALAMQYHPEWMSEKEWGFKFAQNLASMHLKQFGKVTENVKV